jgi:hypothetical protein
MRWEMGWGWKWCGVKNAGRRRVVERQALARLGAGTVLCEPLAVVVHCTFNDALEKPCPNTSRCLLRSS